MNDGGYVSKTGIIAGALWLAVLGLLVAAWVVILAAEDYWTIAGMLAASGCALSALAATLHIKTYACRVTRVVRATARGGDTGVELRSLN